LLASTPTTHTAKMNSKPLTPGATSNSSVLATTISAVKKSAQLIDDCLRRDEESPEIWDFFNQTSSGQYTFDNIEQFFIKKKFVIPVALLEEYNFLECKSFMGLFPEINRAWVTIDNRLYLWNYEEGNDILPWDELDQIIVSVGLANPKANVFEDSDIKYVLVLATPVEVVLLVVKFNGNDIALHPTKFALPSDNVNMLKIVGSSNGRIFMAGGDGDLYEFDYKANENSCLKCSGRRCTIVNHSTSKLVALLPSFIRFTEKDPLVDITIDRSRNILYTLSEHSAITVYDLGLDGNSLSKISTTTEISKQAIAMCPRVQNWDSKMFQIVNISAIETTESGPVHLVAITRGGLRLYFSTLKPHTSSRLYYHKKNRPEGLYLVHVRFPPLLRSQNNTLASPSSKSPSSKAPTSNPTTYQPTNVHSTYYGQGILILADARTQDRDILLGICQDIVPTSYSGRTTRTYPYSSGFGAQNFVEKATILEIEGKVWSLAEVPYKCLTGTAALLNAVNTFDKSVDTGRPQELIMRNELALQHLLPPRHFLAFTSTGLHVVVKWRPVDILRQILTSAGGNDTKDLKSFFATYGADQACAMCLILACGETYPSTRLSSSLDVTSSTIPEITEWATQTFFRLGGGPSFDNPTNTTLSSEENKMKAMRFSASHDGFAMYLSRLLRPIWSQTILEKRTKQITYNDTDNMSIRSRATHERVGEWLCRLSKAQLTELEASLINLRQFLSRNPHFAAIRTQEMITSGPSSIRMRLLEIQKRKLEEEAKKIEQTSLSNLHLLLLRSLECLNLLSVLNDFLPQLTEKLSAALISKMNSMKFRDLVATEEGFQTMRSLVDTLIQDARVESISNLLAERCPSFFSEADKIKYQALELLNRAKTTENTEEREKYLKSSLDMFIRISDHISNQDLLRYICEEYQFLRYYEGVMILALECARAADTSGLALQWFKDGMNTREERGKEAYNARLKCYQNIINVLDELLTGVAPSGMMSREHPTPRPTLEPSDLEEIKIRILKIARKSADELFHMILYRWYIDRGLSMELIQLQTPYMEQFLKYYCEPKSLSLDLLWRYYVKQKKYAQAAVILTQLAESKDETLKLEDRLEHLARAITNAKSAMGQGSASQVDGELLRQLEDKMEVARIQLKIYHELDQIQDASVRSRAKADLDRELYSISDLYNKFAKQYGLCESALEIIHTARYNDPNLIRKLWDNIISDELQKMLQHKNFEHLRTKISSLTKVYATSDLVFPLEYLVEVLEKTSIQYRNMTGWRIEWVVACFLSGGVPHYKLFYVYDNLLVKSVDPFWKEKPHQLHLIAVVSYLLRQWIDFANSTRISPFEVKQFQSKQIDTAIEKYITSLQTIAVSSQEANKLIDELKDLKKQVLAFKPQSSSFIERTF